MVVVCILTFTTWYPNSAIYEFLFDQAEIAQIHAEPNRPIAMFMYQGMPDNTVPLRLKLTAASTVITGIVMSLMLLLRKACRSFDIKLLERILTWGFFYQGIMTVLMIVGMWLDFRMFPNGLIRIGYLYKLHVFQ